MKIEQTTLVAYDEVGPDFRMKLPALFQRLQRAALERSEAVGLGSEAMLAAGAVWLLSRMCVDIRRRPRYREPVTVHTWHKGSAGFRAGRDFVMTCGGEPLAAATSQWLYYDLARQRIAKIPADVSGPYTSEGGNALEDGAIDFAVDRSFDPQTMATVTTRAGDYDPNGHVNNAVYLDYLETLIQRAGIAGERMRRVGIHYLKEIGRGVDAIQAGMVQTHESIGFRFFDRSTVYAAGFVDTSASL